MNMSNLFRSFLFLSIVLVNGKKISVTVEPQYAFEIATASLDCIPKTGVQLDIIQRLVDWNFQENDRVKKFIYCFGTASGYATEDGHFNIQKMTRLIGNNRLKNEVLNTVKECNKVLGENKYETLYKASVCFHDNTPILFKL